MCAHGPRHRVELGQRLFRHRVVLLVMASCKATSPSPPVFRTGLRHHPDLLPWRFVGRLSIQPGIGALPRKRAARPTTVDSAIDSAIAEEAVAREAFFLRGLIFVVSFHGCAMARTRRRFRHSIF